MNNRGSFDGLIYTIVTILGFLLCFAFVFIVVSGFDNNLQANNSSYIPVEAKDMSSAYVVGFNAFDLGAVLLLLGCLIVNVVVIRGYPERNGWFIVAGFIAMLVFGLVGFILENFWFSFANNSVVSSSISSWVYIPFLMDNFVFVLIFYVAVITAVAMTSEGGVNF